MMMRRFIITAFLILSHSLTLSLCAAGLPPEEMEGVRCKRPYSPDLSIFQQSPILPKRSRIVVSEAMDIDATFQIPLMRWVAAQPAERWAVFMTVFKTQNWTSTQWTTEDWEDVMCDVTLCRVIRDGSLRQAIITSPSPEVQALLPYVPLPNGV